MADVNTAEVEAKVDAAFGAAFSGDNAPAPAAVVVEEVKPDAAPAPAPAPTPPPAPKYARVTQEEWNNAKAAAGKVANLESQLAKLVGSAPNTDKIVQQALEQLRSQTPAGMTVEMSDEDFAELAADFPELAKHTRAAFEKIFKKAQIKGTGTATPPAPTVDEDAVAERVRLRLEEDALKRTYPDWSDVVGRPPTPDAPIPDSNPFRVWLGKQNAAYQKAVNETNSYADIQAAIADFRASERAPAHDRAAARRAVIEDAVTPRAEGNAPPLNRPQSAEEAFGNAFKAAKRH